MDRTAVPVPLGYRSSRCSLLFMRYTLRASYMGSEFGDASVIGHKLEVTGGGQMLMPRQLAS
jgi:hypothetical protein